jgi:uncharacterized protein YbaR (Trm112 family)
MLDAKLLDILACPICKGKLIYQKQQQQLICKVARKVYAIEDGIPVMLTDQAIKIRQEEYDALPK